MNGSGYQRRKSSRGRKLRETGAVWTLNYVCQCKYLKQNSLFFPKQKHIQTHELVRRRASGIELVYVRGLNKLKSCCFFPSPFARKLVKEANRSQRKVFIPHNNFINGSNSPKRHLRGPMRYTEENKIHKQVNRSDSVVGWELNESCMRWALL
jgi:hypothetical protein